MWLFTARDADFGFKDFREGSLRDKFRFSDSIARSTPRVLETLDIEERAFRMDMRTNNGPFLVTALYSAAVLVLVC